MAVENQPENYEKVRENVVGVDDKSALEMGFSCSCNYSRRNSTVWSESNEEKSQDLETSSSCVSEESKEIGVPPPVAGHRISLLRRSLRVAAVKRGERLMKQRAYKKFNQKKRKSNAVQYQFWSLHSMMMMMDTRTAKKRRKKGYDLECSYAIVQRAKQQLLHKLCRFEKLAELDPIELEKIMLEEQEDDEDDEEELVEEEEFEDDELLSLCRKR
ncbi:hypothetical protein F0562_016811 [Nyssa sinensis]|uniref:Uncharacterized protein n=1 Tax=Nyssa sinensis TaxID=561372 RepID=A0A5J4ZDM0_9ASTE|nr:hypothetical protein F0562_016811 [Nyssa sinensis]